MEYWEVSGCAFRIWSCDVNNSKLILLYIWICCRYQTPKSILRIKKDHFFAILRLIDTFIHGICSDKSLSGHSYTFQESIAVSPAEIKGATAYEVSGTPVDCVSLALSGALFAWSKPQLVCLFRFINPHFHHKFWLILVWSSGDCRSQQGSNLWQWYVSTSSMALPPNILKF